MTTESKLKGGYLGIQIDKDGYLLEASIATVALLLKNGDFLIPPFNRIIKGTTAIQILDYLEKEVLPNYLTYIERLGESQIK